MSDAELMCDTDPNLCYTCAFIYVAEGDHLDQLVEV